MKKIRLVLIVCFIISITSAQAQFNSEIALVVAPLDIDLQESYSLLYRRSLQRKGLSLRATLGLGIDYDKEWRADSVSINTGSFSYNLAVGLQHDLKLGDLEKINGYVATDLYYNSALIRRPNEAYYGYYWNTGLRPLAGMSYMPLSNVKLSIEARSDFNVNLQGYSADGVNRDVRISFIPMNELVLGIGYLF